MSESKGVRRFGAVTLAGVVAVISLAACSSGGGSTSSSSSGSPAGEGSGTASAAAAAPDHVDAADYQWNAADEVKITLNGRSATAARDDVKVDGSTVTIGSAGTYRLSGKLESGQVVVDSSGDGIVRLVLDGADITSSTAAAIAVMKAGEVMVVLADGTTNRLADAAKYVFPSADVDEPNAALYSAADLTIAGKGSLTVDGNFNDAIASQDGLVVSDGTITVDAVDDGLRGKDYLVINGGTLTVTAGGDGLKADNAEEAEQGYVAVKAGTLKITAAGDGISAVTNVLVGDGKPDITAGGGSAKPVAATASAKGLKGTKSVVVDGGSIKINAADDAVHSDDTVVVNGGDISIATGDDGMHADATLTVNGGTINITESYEGIESSALTIAGGEVRLVSRDDGVNGAVRA